MPCWSYWRLSRAGFKSGYGCGSSVLAAFSGPSLSSGEWTMFLVAFAAGFFYVWINLRVALSKSSAPLVAHDFFDIGNAPSLPAMKLLGFVASAFVGLMLGSVFYPQWDAYLRFRFGGSFGLTDPIFGVDSSFYVFHLPFYQRIQNSLTGLALGTFILVLVAYAFAGFSQLWQRRHSSIEAILCDIFPFSFLSSSPAGRGVSFSIVTSCSTPQLGWYTGLDTPPTMCSAPHCG